MRTNHVAAEFSPASDSDGVQPFQPELVTEHLPHFLIQPKQANRRTSLGCQSADFDTERDQGAGMCGKMFRPFVVARMKEGRDMAGRWVDSR